MERDKLVMSWLNFSKEKKDTFSFNGRRVSGKPRLQEREFGFKMEFDIFF